MTVLIPVRHLIYLVKDDGYDVPGGYAGRVLTGVGPGTQFGYPPETRTPEDPYPRIYGRFA